MEENEKSYSKLEWLFYIVIFPLFFTLILTGLLLAFLGEDVMDNVLAIGQKIPGLSTLLADSELAESDENNNDMEGNDSANEELDRQIGISQEELNPEDPEASEITQLEHEVQEREEQIEQLNEQLVALESNLGNQGLTEEEKNNKLRDLAGIYQGMSAKKAAAILENLPLDEMALIMEQMPRNQQSSIMARLDPAIAAKLTLVLKGTEENRNTSIDVLPEFDLLMDTDETSRSTVTMNQIVNTFSKMPTSNAAALLAEMSNSNREYELATKILANMNDTTRSEIIAQMDPQIAKNYINSLVNESANES